MLNIIIGPKLVWKDYIIFDISSLAQKWVVSTNSAVLLYGLHNLKAEYLLFDQTLVLSFVLHIQTDHNTDIPTFQDDDYNMQSTKCVCDKQKTCWNTWTLWQYDSELKDAVCWMWIWCQINPHWGLMIGDWVSQSVPVFRHACQTSHTQIWPYAPYSFYSVT